MLSRVKIKGKMYKSSINKDKIFLTNQIWQRKLWFQQTKPGQGPFSSLIIDDENQNTIFLLSCKTCHHGYYEHRESKSKYKMKNIKYHTAGTFPKSNLKIVETDKMDTHNTHTYTNAYCLGEGTFLDRNNNKYIHKGQLSKSLTLGISSIIVIEARGAFNIVAARLSYVEQSYWTES